MLPRPPSQELGMASPTPSWLSSAPQGPVDKCSLWPRCYEALLPHLSLQRVYSACETLSRAGTFQQLCCNEYSWRLSHLLNVPEALKESRCLARTSEHGSQEYWGCSFPFKLAVMLDYPSRLVHMHIWSMSLICLPGFQHERFLKSQWRTNEPGPQQWCQD